MATDFFQKQENARRNTTWLVVMFLLAVVGIVGTTFVVVAIAVSGYRDNAPLLNRNSLDMPSDEYPWQLPLLASGGALALVGGGTLFKVSELRMGGGQIVAEKLGGRRLQADSREPGERRLLNVVEEMAIASGVPVPPVYLLDEQGINAFAAGYSPSDAVLGITRGAVDNLSRDELQGVIAHEFSHLLNGDMRMNIRLIGILHGILLLGLLGQMLLRSVAYGGGRSRDKNNGVLVLLAVSVALIVLGFAGSLLGGLIKAAVSRQREYLADASAVQFTRNPGGIAGALKKIGGLVAGSQVKAAAAAEASHMFFATGVWEGFTSLMATHPPLAKRILAIEPNWKGDFPQVSPGASLATHAREASAFVGNAAAAAGLAPAATRAAAPIQQVDLEQVDHAADTIGMFTEQHRRYAQQLIESMPASLVDAAREPFGARAVVFALLLDKSPEVRQRQLAALELKADRPSIVALHKLVAILPRLEDQARLPLLDLTLPALRSMSEAQYQQFDACLTSLIEADSRLSLFEWTLGRVLERHLAGEYRDQRRTRIAYYGLGKLGQQLSVLLSTLAHVGHDAEHAAAALATAAAQLPEVKLHLRPRNECSLAAIEESLNELCRVAEKHRGRIVDACAAVICADGKVTVAEAELLRGISDLLDCPMPPILPGQQVAASQIFKAHTAGESTS
jgi:Zn-dependent protease with chaperone function